MNPIAAPHAWRAVAAVARSAAALLCALCACGCANGLLPASQRVAPYRPRETGRDPAKWASERPGEAARPASAMALRKGDHITVSLRGIPQPEQIEDVVDETGCVTLPHLGSVRVENLTRSEAERTIERAYLDGGIFRNVTVNIVAQEIEYFVEGEVRSPGRYPLASEVTLLQAIVTAGGYTDFARRSNIELFRAGRVTVYDADQIEKRQMPDPVIMRGDRVVVRRRFLLP